MSAMALGSRKETEVVETIGAPEQTTQSGLACPADHHPTKRQYLQLVACCFWCIAAIVFAKVALQQGGGWPVLVVAVAVIALGLSCAGIGSPNVRVTVTELVATCPTIWDGRKEAGVVNVSERTEVPPDPADANPGDDGKKWLGLQVTVILGALAVSLAPFGIWAVDHLTIRQCLEALVGISLSAIMVGGGWHWFAPRK
jgi:hypothetical protein